MVWLKLNELNFSERFKQKVSKYCSTHFNIKVYRTHKHTDLPLVSGLLLIYQICNGWICDFEEINES